MTLKLTTKQLTLKQTSKHKLVTVKELPRVDDYGKVVLTVKYPTRTVIITFTRSHTDTAKWSQHEYETTSSGTPISVNVFESSLRKMKETVEFYLSNPQSKVTLKILETPLYKIVTKRKTNPIRPSKKLSRGLK